MKNKQQAPATPQGKQNLGNRHSRRKMHAQNRKRNANANRVLYDDQVVYTDESYKDTSKKVYSHNLGYVKERVRELHKHFHLPTFITTRLEGKPSTCVIINRDGRERDFLPDVKPVRKILVKGRVARQMLSGVCMLVRATSNYDEAERWLDGSWAITPAEYRMMNTTTIQHVHRRPLWFLRKYPYEITFDGKVWPAHLLYDYELEPTRVRTTLHLTRETITTKDGSTNTYFRFWKHSPQTNK